MNRGLATGLVALTLLIIGLVVLARWVSQVDDSLAALDTRLATIDARLDEAEARAESAEERAARAEQDAAAARGDATTAAQRAEVAAQQAQVAEGAREQAETARLEAEERSAEATEKAAQATQEAEEAKAEAEELRLKRERELTRLESALGALAETRRTALGLVMNLGNSVEFDFDKAALRPENRELLSRIAGILMTADDFQIQVFGHTDDVGSASYNEELSERRAQAVRDYLVSAGIDPEIVSVKGFGKSQPLVEGTDEEARQRNRRVEIAVIQVQEQYRPIEPPG